MKILFCLISLVINVVLQEQGIPSWPEKDYYGRYTHLNFRTERSFKETIDLKNPDIRRFQAVLFFLTNEIRVKFRLLPLAYSPNLEKTAQMHAEAMVSEDFFSHLNPHHSRMKTPNDRARLNQISNPFLAENIIEGYGLQYTSNKEVYLLGKGMFSYKPEGELLQPHTYLSLCETLMHGWMNSREHRKNILSRDAIELGCGISFYSDPGFNEMPSCKAVQNFQWYRTVQQAKSQ